VHQNDSSCIRRGALSALVVLSTAVVAAIASNGLTMPSAAARLTPAGTRACARSRRLRALDAAPMAFERNDGQADARVKFIARGEGYTLFLTADAVLASRGSRPLRFALVGAGHDAAVSGERPLRVTSNYFIGNDPRRWRRNVPSYSAVRYRDVYLVC